MQDFRLAYHTDKLNLSQWIQRIKDAEKCLVTIHNHRVEIVCDTKQFPHDLMVVTRLIIYENAHKTFYTAVPRIRFSISPVKWVAALRNIVKLKGKNKSLIILECSRNQLVISLGFLSEKRDSWEFKAEPEKIDIQFEPPPFHLPKEIRAKIGSKITDLSRIVIPLKILNDICLNISVVHCLDDIAPMPGTRPTKMILFTLTAKYLEISSDPNYRARARFRIGNSTPTLFRHDRPISQLHSFRDFAYFCGKQKTPRLVVIGMAPNMALVYRQEDANIAARETYSVGFDV